MPLSKERKPEWLERSIAALCYVSAGLIGLLYIIITGSRGQSNFFRFHFLQSIVLGLLGFLLNFTFNIMFNILGGMAGLIGTGEAAGMFFHYVRLAVDVIMRAGFLLLLYGLVFSLLGKLAEIPIISNLVRRNMGSF